VGGGGSSLEMKKVLAEKGVVEQSLCEAQEKLRRYAMYRMYRRR
jgi:hypothetical protein